MVRNLLALALALAAFWAFQRVFRRSRSRVEGETPPDGGGRAPGREPRKMVRDPQCGTFIPRDTALALPAGDGTRYFCCEACREAWRRESVSRSEPNPR